MTSKKWVPMKQVPAPKISDDSDERAKKMFEGAELFENDRYVAIKRQVWFESDGDGANAWWLSIRTQDRTAERDWRDFQNIKNDVCGPEMEAMEIYPAESRLVDTSNQFHLWVIDQRIPFGFEERMVSDENTEHTRQRPWHPSNRPNDCTTLKGKVTIKKS